MLKLGGRSATIVPDGVLFGSSKAHVQLRQHLIENNQLEAVISLPSGVFKPYAGVSTAIIIFAKGGKTENVFFYDVQSDGFTLDDKRTKIGDGKGDMTDLRTKYLQWCEGRGDFRDRTAKAFEVPADEIRAQSFDLSINRYKQVQVVMNQHESPILILKRLQTIESEIAADLAYLSEMIR
jgi:type I restriction enzyme M protein